MLVIRPEPQVGLAAQVNRFGIAELGVADDRAACERRIVSAVGRVLKNAVVGRIEGFDLAAREQDTHRSATSVMPKSAAVPTEAGATKVTRLSKAMDWVAPPVVANVGVPDVSKVTVPISTPSF